MSDRNQSHAKGPRPEDKEAFLKRAAAPTSGGVSFSVCLGPTNNGFATLMWSATSIGSDDWVGLYASPPSSGYEGYLDWEWATKGSSFETGNGIAAGQVAIYWSWNASTKQYVNVAQTPAFPAQVCSS